MAKKSNAGRKPYYVPEDLGEMQKRIDDYFKSCDGEPLIIDGVPFMDKNGNPVMIHVHPPTVTGLALALGFNSRMGLLSYDGKPEFSDTIARAKARVERYAEERLFDRDGANGAKFSLANNFKNWREKQEITADVKTTTVTVELVDDE